MTIRLASLPRCAEICGLLPQEIITGVSLAGRHERMLERYRRLSRAAVRAQLVAEIRDALRMEAFGRAADLLIVLRIALAQTVAARATARRRGAPVRLARARWLPNADYFTQEPPPKREVRGCVIALEAVVRTSPA